MIAIFSILGCTSLDILSQSWLKSTINLGHLCVKSVELVHTSFVAPQFHTICITGSPSCLHIRHAKLKITFLLCKFATVGKELLFALQRKFFTFFGTKKDQIRCYLLFTICEIDPLLFNFE